MERILTTIAAVLMAGAAFAADGKPTKVDADISYSVAVRTMVRMDLCEGEGRYDQTNLWLLRKYTLEDAAEISGRDINEVLVEAKDRADTIAYHARRKNTVDLYCDPAARPKAYRNLRLAAEASESTKETLATLDRLIDERRDAEIALDLCDLSDADKVKTLEYLNAAREWSYLTTGICWKGQCRTNDRQLKEALKAISNKKAVCRKHDAFLAKLPDHPVYWLIAHNREGEVAE